MAASLTNALRNGTACTIIVAADPKSFIQRIESFGAIRTAEVLSTNQLRFFTMQAEFSKKLFQFGAESFVQELENFSIPPNSYLVFDQADELLSLHDIALAIDQVDVLRRWCLTQRVTLLLVFLRAAEVHISTLNALMDNMTGIARLGGNKDGLELTFDYWQSPEGTVAARSFQLVTLDSGLYEATANAAPPEKNTDRDRFVEPDYPVDAGLDFFYMDPDLGSLAKQMTGVWRHVDTLVGMMHATRNKRAATCILTYQRDTNLRQLAEAVHTLRLSLGKHARIVVQEKEASLRYQNEALLLSLGVNLVVNRDVPSSRLPLMLDSLVGQIFARDVDINFEAALTSVLPTQLRGYLPPLRFLREVTAILSRGETLNIPCAMIRGKPGPGVEIAHILASSGLSRPGDLITADGEYCFLFLNACPQAVMLVTIDRILGKSTDALFEDVRFMVKREEIQTVLDALAHDAAKGELPDYSSIVSTTPISSTTPAATQPASVAPVVQVAAIESKDLHVKSVPQTVVTAGGATAITILADVNSAPPSPKPEKRLYSYNHAPPTVPVGRSTALRAKRSQFAANSTTTPVEPIQ